MHVWRLRNLRTVKYNQLYGTHRVCALDYRERVSTSSSMVCVGGDQSSGVREAPSGRVLNGAEVHVPAAGVVWRDLLLARGEVVKVGRVRRVANLERESGDALNFTLESEVHIFH